MSEKAPKRILILGAGYAGLDTARHLEKLFANDNSVEITLVNQTNYLVFTPMLAEVVASSIEAKHVVIPLRELFKKVSFKELEVHSIDLKERKVTAAHCTARCDTYPLQYDYLVLALGSITGFHGVPGAAQYSFPLKDIADAMVLRNHVLDTFEHADVEQDAEYRRQLLTFVVIGGGYTGIEVAAELNEFVQSNRRFYRNVRPDEVKVIVIDPGPRIMHEINESLAAHAMSLLQKRGMEFRLQTRVKSVTPDAVELEDGTNISTNTAIWAAGTAPQPVIETLPCENKRGKIVVNEYMEVPNWPGVWALGDCANIPDPKTGAAYPPTAQHAVREGRQAAHNIAAAIRDRDQDKKPFEFSTIGMLAPLGHRTAVAEIKGFKISGFFAWFLWRAIYLGKVPGWDRKIRVALDWALDLFLPRDIAQLPILMKQKQPADSK